MKPNPVNLFYKGTAAVLVVALSVVLAACSSPTAAPPTESPATTTPSAPQRQGAGGTIASISGTKLTLTTAQGQATVNIGPATRIEKAVTGALNDLVPGQVLIITGTPDSSGKNVTATNITIRQQDPNAPLPSPDEANPSLRRRPGNGTGTGPSGTPGERGIVGVLTTLNGNTLTITTAQTAQVQVIVTVTPGTVIEKTASGIMADLKTGDFVTVFGTADSSGNINAVNITDRQ